MITATESEVTCRLPLDLNREAKEYELIAYSSTFEEANCEFGDCLFTFIAADQLPNVESYSISYDSTEQAYMITITGIDFEDEAEDVEFFLDSIE